MLADWRARSRVSTTAFCVAWMCRSYGDSTLTFPIFSEMEGGSVQTLAGMSARIEKSPGYRFNKCPDAGGCTSSATISLGKFLHAHQHALFRFLGVVALDGSAGSGERFRGKGRPRALNYAHRRDESPNELSPGESSLSLSLSLSLLSRIRRNTPRE
jgi:hypothetical protein